MPNRSVLNKYALFASELQKVRKKKEWSKEEAEIVNKARLFAMLSSGHCWHVYKFMHGSGFDKEAIANEVKVALEESWKDVTEDEMKEVITQEIEEHAFSTVLIEAPISPEERRMYQELLPKLKQEFADGMEPIENKEE